MWSPWKGQHSLNLHDAAALEFTSKVVLVSVGPRWRLQGQVKERKITLLLVTAKGKQRAQERIMGVRKWIKTVYASNIIMPER